MNRRFRHLSIRQRLYRTAAVSILILATLVSAAAAREVSVVAVKAGMIYPVTSAPIRDGIILILDGKITAVGKDLEIPEGAEVIDATDKVVPKGRGIHHLERPGYRH